MGLTATQETEKMPILFIAVIAILAMGGANHARIVTHSSTHHTVTQGTYAK